jgi:hypothetical protein
MGLHKPHAPVRALLACALHDPQFRWRLISPDRALTICNSLAPNNYLAAKNTLVNALKGSGDAADVDLSIFLKGDAAILGCSDFSVLAIPKARRTDGGRERLTAIGYFESPESVPIDEVVCSNDEEMQWYSLQGENKLQIPQHTLEQYHVYAEKYFTKIQDWAELKQKKQHPNNVEAQRPDPPQAERSEKEELMTEYASNNAQIDSVCSQLRDLYASISVLKKCLDELGVSSETAKPKTELMVYTLLHERSGAIEVDVDNRGVVFTSDLVNGVVLRALHDSLHIHARL